MILFILPGHKFVFFVKIAFQRFSSWNFTHIQITSLFTCTIFFQIFSNQKVQILICFQKKASMAPSVTLSTLSIYLSKSIFVTNLDVYKGHTKFSCFFPERSIEGGIFLHASGGQIVNIVWLFFFRIRTFLSLTFSTNCDLIWLANIHIHVHLLLILCSNYIC